MANKNLINIPIGQCGLIGDKMYEAKGAEYFGAKGCLTCDLHEPGFGCTNGKVVCYNPPRVFKQKTETPAYDQDEHYDYDIELIKPLTGCLPFALMLIGFWVVVITGIIILIK